jgi:hypothetical protein
MSSDSSNESDESDIMILKRHENHLPRRQTFSRKKEKPAEDPTKTIEFETTLYINKRYLVKSIGKSVEDDSDTDESDPYDFSGEDYTDIDEIIAPGMTFTMKYIYTGNYYVEKTMDVSFISRVSEVDHYWDKYVTFLGCILKPVIPILVVDKDNYRAKDITLLKGDEIIAKGSVNKRLITP